LNIGETVNIPDENETHENVVFLYKHFLKVVDANIQKNELHRLIKTQALVFKFFEHVGSYIYLLRDTKIPDIVSRTFCDVGTLSVTARAALETLLAFYHLAIEPKTDEELDFRINCLLYSGIFERNEAFESFTKDSKIKFKEKMDNEKTDLEKLKNIITNSGYYHELKPGTQKDIISQGKWKLKSWKEIALCLGINEEHFKVSYGYLCTQAHSGGNSFIQMRMAIVEKDINGDVSMLNIIVIEALSLMTNLIVKMSPYSKEEHLRDSKAVDYVNFYLDLTKVVRKDL